MLRSIFILLVLIVCSTPLFGTKRYWIATSTGNWNSTANWSATSGGTGGASVPTTSDSAYFDPQGYGDCTINDTVNVKFLSISGKNGGYAGQITQGNYKITVGSSGLAMSSSSGTFTGNTSTTLYPIVINGPFTLTSGYFAQNAFTFTVNGTFTQSGGTFAAAGKLQFRGNVTMTGGTFTAGTGIANINGTRTINASGKSFYKFVFLPDASNACVITVSNDFNVTDSLIYGGTTNPIIVNGPGKKINASGHIAITNTVTAGGGTAILNIMGATSKTLTGSGTALGGALGNVTIAKTSSSYTTTLASTITVAGNLTYTSGVITPGSSLVVLTNNYDGTSYSSKITTSGDFTTFNSSRLANLTFSPSAALTDSIPSGDTLTATGTLTLAGGSNNLTLKTGKIIGEGHITVTNTGTGGGGDATLIVKGTGSQTLTGSGTSLAGKLCHVNINKPSGTLSLSSIITFAGDLIKTTGSISVGTSTLVMAINTSTTISGALSTYNLILNPVNTSTLTISNAVSISNLITIQGGTNPLAINTGTLTVTKNITITNTASSGGGTGTIYIVGGAAQTITGTSSGTMPLCNVEIQKYNSGTSNALTLTDKTTIGGNLSFIGYVWDSPPMGQKWYSMNTGTFEVLGDLNFNHADGSWLVGGSAIIELKGSTNVSVTGYSAATQTAAGVLPSLKINKTNSTYTVTLNDNIPIQGNLTYSAGTVSSGTSTVYMHADGATSYTLNMGAQPLNNLKVGNGNTTTTGKINLGANLYLNGGFELLGSWTNRTGAATAVGKFDAGAYNMDVKGDWTNNTGSSGGSNFTPGTGTVIFSGSTALQYINGSPTSQTFYNIELAKSALAKTIQVAGSITTLSANKLTLTSGLFIPPATMNLTATTGSCIVLETNGMLNNGSGNIINVSSDWTNNGGLCGVGSSHVKFIGSKNPQYINGTGTQSDFYDFTVQKDAGTLLTTGGSITTIQTNNLVQTTGNFTAPANLYMQMGTTASLTISAGTFTAGSQTRVNGNFTNNAATQNFVAGTGTITFTGTGSQSINGTNDTLDLYNVVVNKTAGTLLSAGGSVTTIKTNNVTLTMGNFTAPATLNMNAGTTSALTITTGTLTAGSAINITGNWTNNAGTTNYVEGTGLVKFTGTGTQTINGTTATQEFYNVEIAKTGGTLLTTGGSVTTLKTNNITQTTGN
ncbi:MAG TPA: hypothetical protein VGF30_15420, partial [Bacteroidia bacterium]